MKIRAVESFEESVPLVRPYRIAYSTTSQVQLFFVRVHGDAGCVGRGCAAPDATVTGETDTRCRAALRRQTLD